MTPSGAGRQRDPGRQPERTRLSWRRTVLTASVVALLAGRLAADRSTPAALVVLTAVAAGWLVILAVAGRRITALAAAEPAPVRWAVPLTAVTSIGYAGLGALLLVATA
jgi:hypothetical protein